MILTPDDRTPDAVATTRRAVVEDRDSELEVALLLVDQELPRQAVEPIRENFDVPPFRQGVERLHLPTLPGVLFVQDLGTPRSSRHLAEQRQQISTTSTGSAAGADWRPPGGAHICTSPRARSRRSSLC